MVNWRSTKKRVFVLTSRLYETGGGRTRATIERMMFLQKHFDVTLIEMSAVKYPGEELPAIFAKYNTSFRTINPWTITTNDSSMTMNYLELLSERTGGLGDTDYLEGKQENFTLPTLSGGKIKGYTEDGKLKRLREYHPGGKVELFALDDNQNIFLRELHESDKLITRYYLDDAGKVVSGFRPGKVVSGFRPGKDGHKQYVYRKNNGEIVYSENISDHNFAFLNDILMSGDTLISDVRHYDEVLERLDPKTRKIYVWHEVATGGATSVRQAYQRFEDPAFSLWSHDRIVVFTNEALEEYECSFPHLKNAFVAIPYGTDVLPDLRDIQRDKHAIVSIGRLQPEKNVAAQIRAFAIFHANYPETTLNIFGDGDEKTELEHLASDLGLGDVVKFHGFVDNTDEQFQRSSMMIFSSNNESFGLAILESLKNGTPVVSYDVRFGAKMMITDLQNGMISKERTPESLAEAMAEVYEAQLHPQQVRDSIKTSFSRKEFEKKWLTLLSNTEERF